MRLAVRSVIFASRISCTDCKLKNLTVLVSMSHTHILPFCHLVITFVRVTCCLHCNPNRGTVIIVFLLLINSSRGCTPPVLSRYPWNSKSLLNNNLSALNTLSGIMVLWFDTLIIRYVNRFGYIIINTVSWQFLQYCSSKPEFNL